MIFSILQQPLPAELLTGGTAGAVAALTWKALSILELRVGRGNEQLTELVKVAQATNTGLEQLGRGIASLKDAINGGFQELEEKLDGKRQR